MRLQRGPRLFFLVSLTNVAFLSPFHRHRASKCCCTLGAFLRLSRPQTRLFFFLPPICRLAKRLSNGIISLGCVCFALSRHWRVGACSCHLKLTPPPPLSLSRTPSNEPAFGGKAIGPGLAWKKVRPCCYATTTHPTQPKPAARRRLAMRPQGTEPTRGTMYARPPRTHAWFSFLRRKDSVKRQKREKNQPAAGQPPPPRSQRPAYAGGLQLGLSAVGSSFHLSLSPSLPFPPLPLAHPLVHPSSSLLFSPVSTAHLGSQSPEVVIESRAESRAGDEDKYVSNWNKVVLTIKPQNLNEVRKADGERVKECFVRSLFRSFGFVSTIISLLSSTTSATPNRPCRR
ncbi:hypothetical protein B0H63DRAFT_205782 [Podospora didyma]|uniref:Uncharacterized protein n=1 Tax=Podospora didyma TaxID=330526 RepID=A0AAE0TVT5_9PEZI|nr:hypothetical protein B0H63DRAFT_205782 [Podospora didyma]